MASIRSYRDLEVWKRAMDLTVRCYVATKQFPKEELFGMTSQIRRSAASIPANIAEGHSRGSRKEYMQFLRTARASLKELETYLILAQRVGFLSQTENDEVLGEGEVVGRMLTALYKRLRGT